MEQSTFVLLLCTVPFEISTETDIVNYLAQSVLHEVCPGANICKDNQTEYGFLDTDFPGKKNHCCTDCSCDAECWKKRNCCFPQNTTPDPGITEPEPECLFPVIPQPRGTHRIFYQSYRMISEVNKDDMSSTEKDVATKCGDKLVAPWGTLFPVFSKKTKRIYKNEACAKDANVTDGELWDIVLSCSYQHTTFWSKDFSDIISYLFSGIEQNGCEVKFVYPGKNSELMQELCFEDLISTCKETDFEIPEGFSLSMQDIRTACTSGLVSPYRYKNMYANVFCHICNKNSVHSSYVCEGNQAGRTFKEGSLSGLIDGIFLWNNKEEPSIKSSRRACISENGSTKEQRLCRMIFCPSGQTRKETGECVFPIKEWYTTKCAINLELTPKEPIHVNQLLEFSQKTLKNVSLLVHQWPNNWYVGEIYYSPRDENGNMVYNLFVKMVSFSLRGKPKGLLKNVKTLSKLPWFLKLGNNTKMSLSSDLSYIADVFYNTKFLGLPSLMKLKVDRNTDNSPPFIITKLYFCDQVELASSEYELYERKVGLRNKINNQTLLLGEYLLEYSDSLQPTSTARVCLYNSGFIEINGSYSIAISKFLYWGFIFSFVVICKK